jgi:hypothetical protein
LGRVQADAFAPDDSIQDFAELGSPLDGRGPLAVMISLWTGFSEMPDPPPLWDGGICPVILHRGRYSGFSLPVAFSKSLNPSSRLHPSIAPELWVMIRPLGG